MSARLRRTARELVAGGLGMLSTGESRTTLSARLERAGVAGGAEHRRAFRQLLVTTPELHRRISGVVLSEETFGQRLDNGVPFPLAVCELGMAPGIKADIGAESLAGAPGECVTAGLDHLRDRLTGYAERGARFATWRALFTIGEGRPSERALRANAHVLGRFAALCQELGVLPVVEPRVLSAGDHTIRTCADVTSVTLLLVMRELHDAGVDPAGVVLKPSLVRPGAWSGQHSTADEIAERTVRALALVVGTELAGIAVGWGAPDPMRAADTLAALRRRCAPWPITFCFGRALTDPVLAAWRGDPARAEDGQRALATQVATLAAAVQGRSEPDDLY